jgi:hypothetical protein
MTATTTTEASMSTPDVIIRLAAPHEGPAVARLAELDSARTPAGPVLVAEIGGELWAALSLDDFHAVSDPFRPTGELLFLLVERGRQLRRREERRSRRSRRGLGARRRAAVV